MKNIIVLCPTCQIRVLPKADGTCPGCRRDLSRLKPAKQKEEVRDVPVRTKAAPKRPGYTVRELRAKDMPFWKPVFSMLVAPAETIREIVETNPRKYVILLVMLAGIDATLLAASWQGIQSSLPFSTLLALCILLGPLNGILSLYISGALFRWTGSLAGGQATAEEVRAATAWSSVLSIFSLPLWIPKILIFRESLFTTPVVLKLVDPSSLGMAAIVFVVIDVFLGIWRLVVWCQSLGEVHGFSAWTAFGVHILTATMIIAPVLCFIAFIVTVF